MASVVFPAITDDDIRWACAQIGLPESAFHGARGDDPRIAAIKANTSVDIAACPGSGKTTLLVAKLAILARDWKTRAAGICVLSHTNVAKKEVMERLGKNPVGGKLLKAPHYIGTIHSFANEFMAIPWLTSQGRPIITIDTAITQQARWNKISFRTRLALEQRNIGASSLFVSSAQGDLADLGTFGSHTPTFQQVQNICRESFLSGHFCSDEMFIWAQDFLDKNPDAIKGLRRRFPLVFIDEAQDTHGVQDTLLKRVFINEGDSVVQRLGDPNQGIFDNNEEGHGSGFPVAESMISLPASFRFGQIIADLADPLGIVPYRLQGRGPCTKRIKSNVSAVHTIFVFEDKAGVLRVLPEYARLLISTFPDEELARGIFKVVGQVHKEPWSDKFPQTVCEYYSEYDPSHARSDPKPRSAPHFILLGLERSNVTGESTQCVETIADGIFQLAKILAPEWIGVATRSKHGFIREAIGAAERMRCDDLFREFAFHRKGLTEQLWQQKWRDEFLHIAESLVGKKYAARDDAVEKFLKWSNPKGADRKKGTNIYQHIEGGRSVDIELGSIHSVKGETHSATLLVETFNRTHNLKALLDWLIGRKNGGAGESAASQKRMKLAYVAMTRPSHLLCLAIHKQALDEYPTRRGQKDIRSVLQDKGWRIVTV